MARIEDLALPHRFFMKTYRYRSVSWTAARCVTKPLKDSKFALITTAALHLPEQPPFDQRIHGGDPGFRELPSSLDLNRTRVAHRSTAFDQTGALADRNLVFPLDRFQELEAEGVIGAVNHRHFSFMGSITKPEKLISETAPAVAQFLIQDKVDAVFLIPV